MTSIMGIVNVTPDSFSDGGLYLDAQSAIQHGLHLIDQGADIVDVGGESTRPGAVRVGPAEEQRRVLPVVTELARSGARVSIDTMHAETAVAAVRAGAVIVNDVSGGHADPAMIPAVADLGVHYVVMHWRGASDIMNALAVYTDTVTEVYEELFHQVDAALTAGIAAERLIIDPGLGFAKNAEHNWQVLAHLDRFVRSGYPVLVGAARKRFVGALLAPDATMAERDAPSAVISALAARAGVWGVRVHDVASTRVALGVADAWTAGERGEAVANAAAPVAPPSTVPVGVSGAADSHA